MNFKEYVRRLADDLYSTYKMTGVKIGLDVDVQARLCPSILPSRAACSSTN